MHQDGPITVYATFEADTPTTYTISVNARGGSVSGNPGSAAPGETVTITITAPDVADGTAHWAGCSISYQGENGSGSVNPTENTRTDDFGIERTTVSFTMPQGNVTVTVEQWEISY